MPNELGQRIVDNYNASNNQTPGGDCFAVAYNRVNEASLQVCGVGLPALNAFAAFDRLWAIKWDPQATWLHLPQNYRGKGSAGAMAHIARGTLFDEAAIWSGSLLPGAVIQTWMHQSDFELVRGGNAPAAGQGHYGHSFIFLSYVKQGSTITGMRIADQGFISGTPVVQSRFEFWAAANASC